MAVGRWQGSTAPHEYITAVAAKHVGGIAAALMLLRRLGQQAGGGRYWRSPDSERGLRRDTCCRNMIKGGDHEQRW